MHPDPQKKNSSLIILGIDPGTRITGYGVIKSELSVSTPLDFGCIRPPAHLPQAERYLAIFNAIEQLMDKFRPDAVSIETQFVYKNVQSAMKLGMARAVAMLPAARRSVPVFEYAPRKAKLAVVGKGGASKVQVQKMVQLILKLGQLPQPEDAADALALALCHANTIKFGKNLCLNTSKVSSLSLPRNTPSLMSAD
jgi:crossover junction endodeoxyribonuclease RuvC